jgi:signal transduction histidine kinase
MMISFGCIKHAAAQKIIIYLLYRPEEFTLTIRDNGKGFDLTPLNNNTSGPGYPEYE